MAKSNNDLTLKVGFDIEKFQAEMNKSTSVLNKWASGVQNSIMGVAAGFSALAIGNFVLDVSKLAGEAEGVSAAFEKLPASVKLMQDLKEATAGTVSELDLMKRSVMAANFGINIEALPKLLEFAAVRAKQTGQSVDYLADSIVTGIGRKSALILDNLGISLSAINEELKVTPDYAQAVGNIAERELGKMGEMSENSSTKLERLNANWINMKVAIGDVANGVGLLGTAIGALDSDMVRITETLNRGWKGALVDAIPFLESVFGKVKSKSQELADAQQKQNEIIDAASLHLRDLGLDYEALMNVAGDNVNVMEIWNEMQRMAAERTKTTTDEVEKQVSAVKKLKVSFTESDFFGPLAAGLDAYTSKIINSEKAMRAFVVPMHDGMANAQKLGLAVIDLGEIMSNVMVGGITAFAEAFGQAVAGVGNFGDVIIRSLLGFAKTVGQILIQAGTAVLITKKFLVSNPVAAIAAGAALIAIASAAQSRLKGAASSMGSPGGGGSAGSSSGESRRTENLGQRIVLEFAGDAGKMLKAKLIEQDRKDNRTRS